LVSSRAVVIGVLGAVGLGLAAPARAQSKRYPPDPVDKDAEQATRSDLWNAAVTPERQPYQSLIRGAAEQLAQRTAPAALEAFKKLDQAIQLLPREPEAYRMRGEASLDRRDWVQCATDLAAADAYTQRDDEPPKVMAELHRKLGLCQARAGRLGDAEKTLAEAVASGNAAGELWMRLGEVRIAMGKLDEAIAALRSALDGSEPSAQPLIRFMLAAAYDRARRPADALLEATEGLKLDQQLTVLQNPVIPPIHTGENEYMLGLAYSGDKPRPEYALAYFRRFVKIAPQSPWRKRAEDHIRDVKAAALPDAITRTGTATIDLEAARAMVRRRRGRDLAGGAADPGDRSTAAAVLLAARRRDRAARGRRAARRRARRDRPLPAAAREPDRHAAGQGARYLLQGHVQCRRTVIASPPRWR
jgi:tetratricopeptide (TPR) repeat protein